MFIKLVFWDIHLYYSCIGYAEYHWLDLGMLYADGRRCKNYVEDHVPLVF